MPNFFVVNTASNLIVSVLATSTKPSSNAEWAFYPASEKALDNYYKYLGKNDTLPDIGWMMDPPLSKIDHR